MSLPGIETHALTEVAFDPQSRWLIAAGGDTERKTRRELIAWNLPGGDVRWHVVQKADERISDLAVHPGGRELATKCTGKITVSSAAGKPLRTLSSDFNAGPIAMSDDGEQLVAPQGNEVKIRSSQNGRILKSIPIAKTIFTSAEAVAFVKGTLRLLVAASVINNKGQTTGKLLLVDLKAEKILKSSNIEVKPYLIAIDPQGRWAVVAGERRGRGCLLFWNLEKWRRLADPSAHGEGVASLAASPDGAHLASTGADQIIRLWDPATGKTVARLDEHATESPCGAGVAWSPDGKYIAFATAGKPPEGGVFLYEQAGGKWHVAAGSRPAAAKSTAVDADLRHLEIFGPSVTMDTVGNFGLAANRWPVKCPHCTFPDLDAVPQPYALTRGFDSPGDFTTAELGNFLVRESTRRVLEVATPGACQFYPTVAAKTKKPTDWLLAVPQTIVATASLPKKYAKCSVCGEPKAVSELKPLDYPPPNADVFKSRQWTCWEVGEEVPWYVKGHLRTTPDKLPPDQWTRLCLHRELYFSTRLLLLMRQCKLRGSYPSDLQNRKPAPAEAAWIGEQLQRLSGAKQRASAAAQPAGGDAAKWLPTYLSQNKSSKPLATRERLAAWEKKHGIKLPKPYADFVATVGRHSFADAMGMEGYDVRIVGPEQLDAREYRRDEPEEGDGEAEPDGLLFAVAVNGDGLCFDLRGRAGDYPVYHLDHESLAFTPFAPNFAQAVRRLVERA